MSMYIDTESGDTIFNVYVGMPQTQNPQTVLMVQADGHELEQCLAITGRPHFSRVMQFYGDDAKMIVANWK